MAIVGEIIRATLFYTSSNASVANNVFHWIVGVTTIPDADLLTLVDTWVDNDWGDHWSDTAPNTSTLTDLAVKVMNTDGTVKRDIGFTAPDIDGQDAATTDAVAVSGLIALGTGLPKQVGRKYVPFQTDQNITDGLFTAGSLAELVILLADWAAVLVDGGGGTLSPGLLSRSLEVFVGFSPAGAASSVPAYQRRRKPGVGS